MNAEILAERLLDFAVRIVKVTDALPKKNRSSTHIAQQLLRAGTSVAANYEEARGAESRADFLHKMQVALKELREAAFWLRLVCRTHLLDQNSLEPLLRESLELVLIFSKSVATLKGKSRTKSSAPSDELLHASTPEPI